MQRADVFDEAHPFVVGHLGDADADEVAAFGGRRRELFVADGRGVYLDAAGGQVERDQQRAADGARELVADAQRGDDEGESGFADVARAADESERAGYGVSGGGGWRGCGVFRTGGFVCGEQE